MNPNGRLPLGLKMLQEGQQGTLAILDDDDAPGASLIHR